MVVTRFAPSPTGYLHVGGARTAIFNWLWARRMKGKFLLRIEDTDLKRNTPTATQQVIDDLRWLGIDWDEGPEVGGPNGPYFQSQRLDIYNRYIAQLIDQQKAYYCFDTPEELQAKREECEVQKKGFIYRRPEQLPDESDVEKARAADKPVTVRFAVPQDADIVIQDMVRGEVTFKPAEIGDFIIQKSDGFPTYHFACVVDDELMGVTHICRGQEHLMNTPGHRVLQDALGFRVPVYAHMSVTVSEGGGKLSKRERPKALRQYIKKAGQIDTEQLAQSGGIDADELKSFITGKTTPDMPVIDRMAAYLGVHLPEINVIDFLKSGYLPEAMVNFLALLGWNPGNDREVMPLEELIDCFNFSRMNKSNSLFDRNKLMAFNTEHMRMIPKDTLLSHFKRYLELVDSPVARGDDDMLTKLLELCEGARTLEDVEIKCRFLFMKNDAIEYDPKAVKKVLRKAGAIENLGDIRERFAAMDDFTEQSLETMLRGLAEEKQVGLGKVAQPLRVAICGTTVSLGIFEAVNLLGKESVLQRIDNTLKKFKES